MLILFWILASIGLSHLVVDSHIFWKIKHKLFYTLGTDGLPTLRDNLTPFEKELHYMLNCYSCSGMWAGVLMALMWNPIDFIPWYCSVFICGYVASYASLLGASIIDYLGSK
jgi:hypothetical protein